jgi:hypothetical protein
LLNAVKKMRRHRFDAVPAVPLARHRIDRR